MLLHYVSSMLYNRWCVPKSLYDIFWLPLLFHSPQCKILQWTFTTSSGIINKTVIALITFIISYTTSISKIQIKSEKINGDK